MSGLAASARSADITAAGPMATQCGGPRPSGSPCSCSSSVTSAATAPAQGGTQTEGLEQAAATEALGQPVLPQQQRHKRRHRACKEHIQTQEGSF